MHYSTHAKISQPFIGFYWILLSQLGTKTRQNDKTIIELILIREENLCQTKI